MNTMKLTFLTTGLTIASLISISIPAKASAATALFKPAGGLMFKGGQNYTKVDPYVNH